jgi:hypothetical protein
MTMSDGAAKKILRAGCEKVRQIGISDGYGDRACVALPRAFLLITEECGASSICGHNKDDGTCGNDEDDDIFIDGACDF